MRYLVQYATLAGKHTEDYATEAEAIHVAETLDAAGKRDVVWFASSSWEAVA